MFPGLIARNGFGAAQRRPAFHQQNILDEQRNAIKRPVFCPLGPTPLTGPRHGQSGLFIHKAHRVDLAIMGGNLRQRSLGRFNGRGFSPFEQFGQLCGGKPMQVFRHSQHHPHFAQFAETL